MTGQELVEQHRERLNERILALDLGRATTLKALMGDAWIDLSDAERQQMGIKFYDAVSTREFADLYALAGQTKPEQRYARVAVTKG